LIQLHLRTLLTAAPERVTPISCSRKNRLPEYAQFVKRMLLSIALSGVLLVAAVIVSGIAFSLPVHTTVGPPPSDLKDVETLDISSQSSNTLRAWYVPGVSGHGAILLLHGIRSNRRQVIERMRFLARAGYAVLAIDFQSHGESTGNRITFGLLESLDALSAVEYLHKRLPTEHVGVIGISLGGAAALLGPKPLPVDALVLESVYPDIETAISDRIEARIGLPFIAHLLAKIYLLVMPPIIHIQPEQLRPIDHIRKIHEPVFIISGTADRHTKIDETRALYANAPYPKQLWAITGAGHVDLQKSVGPEYNYWLLEFFGRYLQTTR